MKPAIRNVLQYLNRRSSVNAAAIVISFAFLLSRLLGLLRDRLLVAHFGVGPTVDAYTAAFRLPELLFTLLVSGAFAVAFIPVATGLIEKDKLKQVRELASILLNWLVLATLGIAAALWIFASPLVTLVVPGFDQARHDLTVELTRIMLITPALFAVSSVLGGVAQSFGRFVFFALASVFYNLGIIAGVLWLTPSMGITGVAYGVVAGAALQAAVQLCGLVGLGFRYYPKLSFKRKDVREVFSLMIPRTIDQGIDQVHYTVEMIIGSRLSSGSLTALYYANNLKNVPLALLGSSIATAAFPRLAARAAKGAKKELIDGFVDYARLILFLVLPAAALAFLLRGYLVRLIYGFGDPTTADTLGWFAGSIVAEAFFFLVVRMFYALKDTKTPLIVSGSIIAIGAGLSFGLSGIYGVKGLAMAQSLLAIIEVTILLVILRRKLNGIGLRRIVRAASLMLVATSVMGVSVYYTITYLVPLRGDDVGFMTVGPKVLIIAAVAAVGYLLPAYLMSLNEAKRLLERIWAQVTRPLRLT